MGFCTNVNQQKCFFDKETLAYLLEKKDLLGVLYKLLMDFQNKSTLESPPSRIQVEVKNNWGEKAILNLIGINTTSLISSEMKGSVTFTFIKDISEIRKVEDILVKPVSGLRLIKTPKN